MTIQYQHELITLISKKKHAIISIITIYISIYTYTYDTPRAELYKRHIVKIWHLAALLLHFTSTNTHICQSSILFIWLFLCISKVVVSHGVSISYISFICFMWSNFKRKLVTSMIRTHFEFLQYFGKIFR